MSLRKATLANLLVLTAAAALTAEEQRPSNVPFYTWVREDTFAGFLENDMARFERGEKKAMEYLAETPGRADATNWLGATKVYRAVRAFRDSKSAEGETLLRDALAAMDQAVAKSPDDQGIRATAGGTLVLFASQLPPQHYQEVMRRAREHYAVLYKLQAPALAKFPLHFKGELLAGVADTEFKVGDKERAKQVLQQIVTEMPDTAYAKTAASWLAAPDSVTRESKLACQSCHQAGRLSSWLARQTRPGA